MNEKLHEELIQLTESLRSQLSRFNTYSVAGAVFTYELKRANSDQLATDLLSPAKQVAFLLALLLSTPEPDDPTHIGESDWKSCVELLNSIFDIYGRMFIEGTPEDESAKELWRKHGDVAMPAFLHFFNTDIHASDPQIRDRIERYLVPFDEVLKAEFGLSASEGLKISTFLIDRSQKFSDKMYDLRQSKSSPDAEVAATIDSMFIIDIGELNEAFGEETITNYLNLIGIQRGAMEGYVYLTDHNEADIRALIRADENVCFIPRVGAINLSLHKALEGAILASSRGDAYLSRRDRELERETRDHLERIFGGKARILQTVYETQDQQNEHDLVLVHDSGVIFIECKASPLIEPFRDPEKAYTRIKRHFRSDRGIQKGYEQGARLKRRLDAGETVVLYDDKGEIALELRPEEIPASHCLIVTRDSFGTLAVDLTLLLEKEDADPYPISINVLDLFNIAEVWEYFKYPGSKFFEYLEFRSQRPAIFLADDELDIAGHFLRYGSDGLPDNANSKILADPNNSGVFDDVFRARHLGGPDVKIEAEPLELVDLKGEIQAAIRPAARSSAKVSQKSPCPCGSGMPYKHCCGKKRWS